MGTYSRSNSWGREIFWLLNWILTLVPFIYFGFIRWIIFWLYLNLLLDFKTHLYLFELRSSHQKELITTGIIYWYLLSATKHKDNSKVDLNSVTLYNFAELRSIFNLIIYLLRKKLWGFYCLDLLRSAVPESNTDWRILGDAWIER